MLYWVWLLSKKYFTSFSSTHEPKSLSKALGILLITITNENLYWVVIRHIITALNSILQIHMLSNLANTAYLALIILALHNWRDVLLASFKQSLAVLLPIWTLIWILNLNIVSTQVSNLITALRNAKITLEIILVSSSQSNLLNNLESLIFEIESSTAAANILLDLQFLWLFSDPKILLIYWFILSLISSLILLVCRKAWKRFWSSMIIRILLLYPFIIFTFFAIKLILTSFIRFIMA